MQRLVLALLFVVIFVFAGLVEAEPVDAKVDTKVDTKVDEKVDAVLDDSEAGAPKAGRAKAPARGGRKDENAPWWDDSGIVKALSLTDEQRKKMGEYLKAYREKVPRGAVPEAFHETLVQGNWKNARSESEKVSKRAATSIRMRGDLKIDVLSLLSKEQHKKLVDRYPRLIYKPWRRAMREASPR